VIWGAKMPVENTTDVRSLGRRFAACDEAIEWAASECRDAREIWVKADSEKLVWIATQPGVLENDQLRRFVEEAMVATPPPEKDALRIRACLDGSDGLAYPNDCPRERWAALAMAARGQLPGGTRDDVQRRHAQILRHVCPQPFAEGPRQ